LEAEVLISPLTFTQLLLFGCLGGLFVEALKHVRKLQGKQLPDGFEILVSAILIALGGGVAAIYQGQVQSMLVAAQVGASAPAIIGAWASGGPPPPNGGAGRRSRAARGQANRGASGGAIALPHADIASEVVRALSWRL
jgi:hypothetical protein